MKLKLFMAAAATLLAQVSMADTSNSKCGTMGVLDVSNVGTSLQIKDGSGGTTGFGFDKKSANYDQINNLLIAAAANNKFICVVADAEGTLVSATISDKR